MLIWQALYLILTRQKTMHGARLSESSGYEPDQSACVVSKEWNLTEHVLLFLNHFSSWSFLILRTNQQAKRMQQQSLLCSLAFYYKSVLILLQQRQKARPDQIPDPHMRQSTCGLLGVLVGYRGS